MSYKKQYLEKQIPNTNIKRKSELINTGAYKMDWDIEPKKQEVFNSFVASIISLEKDITIEVYLAEADLINISRWDKFIFVGKTARGKMCTFPQEYKE